MSENVDRADDPSENVDRVDDPSEIDEPDVEALREDLERIKSAMAIEERYPGQRRLWLVHGALVGIAGITTNIAFVRPWPEYAYVLIWLLVFALIGLTQWHTVTSADSGTRNPDPGPNWTIVFGTLAVGLFVLTAIVNPVFADVENVLQGAYFFSLAFTVLGMGYLLAGSILRAARIRALDRYPFYVNGAWILTFALLMPYVDWLQYYGYGLFGTLFFVHGAGTYYLLTVRSTTN
uniref:Uncharacterized protein n=1 Tax=Natrinema halophilum TaxID=1699371 RepID=A0A7D5GWC5_9EURY